MHSAACDSGEKIVSILRKKKKKARALECLGLVAFEPEELPSEIQAAL